jgi:hypothetical protein
MSRAMEGRGPGRPSPEAGPGRGRGQELGVGGEDYQEGDQEDGGRDDHLE